MKEKSLTMWDLEKEMRATIRENKDQLLESKYPEDLITELVDSSVPVYNHEHLSGLVSRQTLKFRVRLIAIEEWEKIKEEVEEAKE